MGLIGARFEGEKIQGRNQLAGRLQQQRSGNMSCNQSITAPLFVCLPLSPFYIYRPIHQEVIG